MYRRNSLSIQFHPEQVAKIEKRFNEFSINGKMDKQAFKKSMGLLGIGQCQFLCNRIFTLITSQQSFDFDEFLDFLSTITFGSKLKKIKLSFDFLDRNSKGYIDRDDIEVIISEISFIWNFLTGEKISNENAIKVICQRLRITQAKEISFKQYFDVYQNEISWFDYFNNNIKTKETIKNPFNIDQMEEYLKLLHGEIENMILDLKQNQQNEEEDNFLHELSSIRSFKSIKGPLHVSSQEFKPKGDLDENRESIQVYRASILSRELAITGQSKLQIVTNKLEQICDISQKLFPHLQEKQLQTQANVGKKQVLINMTEPQKNRQNIIYFGHENWNLMLNMMLGIRKALKTHFYIYENNVTFSQEDLNCKYAHELIYKKNNKSVKEICQIFVDYTPKVFFYIRRYFKIDNTQFLKSVGLENLIGNLLMGNLSSLTEQTSEGKSGSFIYYTEDMRLIIKSIPKEQYRKFRQFLNDYANYVKENPETFLVHIYGLYKLKNKLTKRQIYFVVLNNVFSCPLKINERYDIKGSTYNREAKRQNYNENVILKDIDLMNNHERSFRIKKETKQKIYEQIIKDAEFLARNNIIQYSLLVGIHKREDEKLELSTEKYFVSEDKNEAFFFGIIDIFTDYSAKKVLQNHFFHLFNANVSSLAPEQYVDRFKDFIYKYIFGA